MSDVVTPVTESEVSEHRDDAVGPPPTYQLLHRVRRIGYVLFALQFAGFLAWSAVLYMHFSITSDYSTYNQPWFLIAHGDLDPYSTLAGIPYWRNDAEFLPYVFAPLYWVYHSGLMLPWLQDASVAGAEVVAFSWLCELARDHCKERDAAWLAGLGLLLFVANPWIWWTISFDVHQEVLAVFFAAYMAWDLSRGKRRAFFWLVPVLLGGAPAATYAIGIGLGAALARRRVRDMGIVIAAAGVAWELLIVAVHGDAGVPLARHYAFLASANPPANLGLKDLALGIASHPLTVIRTLWGQRADIFANLAPGGLIGIGAPLIMPLMLVVLLADSLSSVQFSEPLFQNVPEYILLPVGTVLVLAWLLRRHRRAAFVLAGLVAVQAIGWAVVWGPQTVGEWLRVSGPEAATLSSVAAGIPGSAEVVASQGVLGRFSSRTHVYGLTYIDAKVPLDGETYFVVTPSSAIQTLTMAPQLAMIGEVAGVLHGTLLTHANGVWAFRVTPPPGVREITVPDGANPLPAWAASGTAGTPVVSGPVSGWHMAATGAKGYVSDGMEWQEPAGQYRATVTLSAAGPVNVEVWDDTTNTLLARQSIAPTDGIQQIVLPVAAPDAADATVYSGWAPFHADFVPPPPGQRLEVRVWSPGGEVVNVYSADLTTPSGAAPPVVQ